LTTTGRIALLLLFPALLYVALCAALFFMQGSILFPVGAVAPAPPAPAGAQPLELAAESGQRLVGLHVPPARRHAAPLVIIGFSGNAMNGGRTAALLHDLYPEADIVVFHYRGYPPSGGSPSAAALQADALLIHDFVRARFPHAPIVAVGFSVGSAVAAHLAANRPLAGLILVTPFDSLERVAGGHYPWLPVRLLFRHRMEPAEELHAARTPVRVAIVAGERDTLVPGQRTQGLRLAVPQLAFDRTIAGAGHNDIYVHPDFPATMHEALRRVSGQGQ
jgi:uncharacterized protein